MDRVGRFPAAKNHENQGASGNHDNATDYD
jgi:hypothetical protein